MGAPPPPPPPAWGHAGRGGRATPTRGAGPLLPPRTRAWAGGARPRSAPLRSGGRGVAQGAAGAGGARRDPRGTRKPGAPLPGAFAALLRTQTRLRPGARPAGTQRSGLRARVCSGEPPRSWWHPQLLPRSPRVTPASRTRCPVTAGPMQAPGPPSRPRPNSPGRQQRLSGVLSPSPALAAERKDDGKQPPAAQTPPAPRPGAPAHAVPLGDTGMRTAISLRALPSSAARDGSVSPANHERVTGFGNALDLRVRGGHPANFNYRHQPPTAAGGLESPAQGTAPREALLPTVQTQPLRRGWLRHPPAQPLAGSSSSLLPRATRICASRSRLRAQGDSPVSPGLQTPRAAPGRSRGSAARRATKPHSSLVFDWSLFVPDPRGKGVPSQGRRFPGGSAAKPSRGSRGLWPWLDRAFRQRRSAPGLQRRATHRHSVFPALAEAWRWAQVRGMLQRTGGQSGQI